MTRVDGHKHVGLSKKYRVHSKNIGLSIDRPRLWILSWPFRTLAHFTHCSSSFSCMTKYHGGGYLCTTFSNGVVFNWTRQPGSKYSSASNCPNGLDIVLYKNLFSLTLLHRPSKTAEPFICADRPKPPSKLTVRGPFVYCDQSLLLH